LPNQKVKQQQPAKKDSNRNRPALAAPKQLKRNLALAVAAGSRAHFCRNQLIIWLSSPAFVQ